LSNYPAPEDIALSFLTLMIFDLFYNQFEINVAWLRVATDVTSSPLKLMLFRLPIDETSSF
jgi:hypothetical protein